MSIRIFDCDEIKTRHVVMRCRDGILRNAARGLTPEEIHERFLKRVKKDAKTKCWNWLGSCNGSKKAFQYGAVCVGSGKKIAAHRYAFCYYKNTTIPDGLIVRHRCDNTKCVNPDHLELGTQKDNIHDCIIRKRARNGARKRGIDHWAAKLTPEIVKEIVRLKIARLSYTSISRETGVPKGNVASIIQGRSWRHVTGFPHPSIRRAGQR